MKKIIFLALLFVSIFSCSNPVVEKWWDDNKQTPSGSSVYFNVRFEANGGNPVPGDQLVARGAKIAKLPQVTRDADGFGGWFREPSFINEWNFNTDTVMADMTLYAKWYAPIYTVKFNPDGGLPAPADQFIASGNKISNVPAVTNAALPGFTGWWRMDNGHYYEWDFASYTVTSSVLDDNSPDTLTLFARWVSAHYIVTFNANGGLPAPALQFIADGAKAASVPAMTNGTNGFGGWFSDPGFNNEWNFAVNTVTENITLYAKWDPPPQSFTVTFEANGGTPAPEPQLITNGAKAASVPSMTKGNNGFGGWFRDSGFNNEWDFANDTVTGNMSLYARWIEPPPAIYTVTFDANGGNPEPPPMYIVTGGKIPEPTALRKEENRIGGWGTGDWMGFGGWFREPGFVNEWDFANNTVTADMTLYAKWDSLYCTVTFGANGGSPIPRNQDLLQGSKIVEPLAMSKLGNGFGGWYKDISLTEEWNFDDRISEGVTSLTLYAKWVTEYYTVRFDSSGGSPIPTDQRVTYGEKINRPPVMRLEGKGLAGWFRESGFVNEWDFDSDTVVSDMTLYAKWEDAHYNVIFDTSFINPPGTKTQDNPPGQGLPVPNGQDVVYKGRIVEPSYPSRVDYTFVGWYTALDNHDLPNPPGEIWDFDTALDEDTTGLSGSGDFTLYARWVPNIQGMVWIPGGSFIMGDDKTTGSKPARRVKVSGFYMSIYEITQQDYRVVIGRQPSNHYIGLDFLPVERVSWFDAVAFCNVLTEQGWKNDAVPWGGAANQPEPPLPPYADVWDGGLGPGYEEGLEPVYTFTSLTRPLLSGSGYHTAYPISNAAVTADFSKSGYRLPTEAEWEYAARGGNGSPGGFLYSGSEDPLAVAWFNNNSSGTTNEVGKLSPNSLGIYDMSGNVSEWCWDWYGPYDPDDVDDSKGPATGTERVRRGGAWSNANTNLRNVVRNSFTPDNSTWVMGFRVVRGPTQAPRRY